ncbi:DNA polymerase ligase N-terminal domain-containing protein [Gimesia panareensis]|uniref:DNA polymerase ligase N-terminal domain-containing protein n=1 Tax=Gimesia panareensis TaxID=2527978 RepID=UPI00118CCB99|nr:DNA polymerase ligase N-terminal domain-containing protein [Gimesia panareensis]QDU48677.1 Putative DNA ligase-like protein [Gimesia panareensis]
MQQYVILRHDHPELHWDLMLEEGDVLKTWRLPQPPEIDPASDESSLDLTAEELPDHRLVYLEYEGPVSGDRGEVTRWDRGTFTLLERSEDQLVALLTGEELAGRITLKKTDQEHQWSLNYTAFF